MKVVCLDSHVCMSGQLSVRLRESTIQFMHAEQTWANLFPSRSCWKDPSKELNLGKSQLAHDQTPNRLHMIKHQSLGCQDRGRTWVYSVLSHLDVFPWSLFGSERSRRDFHWNCQYIAISTYYDSEGPLIGLTQMGHSCCCCCCCF